MDPITCTICLDRFKDPTTVLCGHNFCLVCINAHWDAKSKSGAVLTCPICSKEYPTRPTLNRNVDLHKLVEAASTSQPLCRETCATSAEGATARELCDRHRKPLVYFCNHDRMSVCYECAVKECDGHTVTMLEDQRDSQELMLKQKQQDVEKLIEETEKNILDLSENISHADVTLQQTSEWVSAKFSSLMKMLAEKQEATEQFLEEQSQATIAEAQMRLNELEEQAQKLRENQEQICALRELPDIELIKESMLVNVPEFEEISTEVSPSLQEKLNGVMDVLARVSKLLHEDLDRAVSTALGQDKQASPQDKRPILAVVPSPAAPFAPGLKEGLDACRCSLSFDARTANSHLFLSNENRKAEHLTSGPRAVPADKARFDHTWQVLCLQGFKDGRHYWELEVSKSWAYLGVTYECIPRKEKGKRCMVGMNELSWSLQLDERQLSAWHNSRRETLNGPSHHSRIGMLLDYEAGTLTYYGDGHAKLHAFHCVFKQELFPAVWIGEGVSISLCST